MEILPIEIVNSIYTYYNCYSRIYNTVLTELQSESGKYKKLNLGCVTYNMMVNNYGSFIKKCELASTVPGTFISYKKII